jgi:hypothetical protein
MANLSFTANNQIIRDLYNTPQEAINASKVLGCDGYRTYIINGETKYVPCSSFIEYEKSLRYRTIQGKIGVFGNETFGDKLVGLQFANSKDEIQGDPFFTLGNFSINKSVRQSQNDLRQQTLIINQQSLQNDTVTNYTADSIARKNLPFFEGKDYIETLVSRVNENITVNVLFDKKKLDKYILFSSLKERFKNTLIEIYNNYTAALHCKAISIITPTISSYVNYPLENRSEFKVNLYGISNPFEIEYTTSGTTRTDNENISQYRNFSKRFRDYVVFYNGVEYPIIDALLPVNYDDEVNGLKLIIDGNPFNSVVTNQGNGNLNFYIKPKNTIELEFFNKLSDLGKFLLNKDIDTGNYVSEFITPTITDSGKIADINETIIFPRFDDFNIDMFTNEFDKFTIRLNDISDTYDSVKTNLISRFLTTDSLKEFDTDDRKFNLILQLYGQNFDNIKKYVDGITFMRNVSYNKIENIPDLLIKNYATMLGLETFNVQDDDTLIQSLFNYNQNELTSTVTPAELDIELWRRILINSSYLYKSKGTRKSIEFILRLVGIPDEIFELNEYIYLADRQLDVIDTLNKIYGESTIDDPSILLQRVPFDSDGYPTVPFSIKYQENGGFINEDKKNIGTFDFGQLYINEYKKFDNIFLFDLYRTVDNVKSWTYNNTAVNRLYDDTNSYTEYESLDSRLTINSKEFEVYLSSNRIFDIAIYRQYFRNIGIVNSDLNITKKFNVSETTFNQFLKNSLDAFINPKNRKTIKTYPSLSKIYFDYLKTTQNPIDNIRSLEFLNKFDTSWIKLIEQFVPSTSITNAGKKIQNSILLDNKYKYLHGQNNDVAWLGTDGSEFQQKALKPVYAGQTNVIENTAKRRLPLTSNPITFNVIGKQSPKVSGTDPTINEYFGVHYTMFEYCDESEGRYYIWESGVNYADPKYGGNINAVTFNNTSLRYGVFTIYDDKLYRLNTRLILNSATSIINTTLFPENLPPNIATKTVNGVTKKIWEHIPYDVDSTTIFFQDSGGQTLFSEERSFYLNSIGRALAYIRMGIDFDCPPPRPHVCYFDTTGKTIDITLNNYKHYTDELNILRTIKQPRYYGYSKNVLTKKPEDTIYGLSNNWASDYKKIHNWVSGTTYYFGELVGKVDPLNRDKLVSGSTLFIVTGLTYTSNNTYPTGSVSNLGAVTTVNNSGLPIVTNDMTNGNPTSVYGGLYEKYEDRTKSDPLMHVDPAYITRFTLNPNQDFLTINLSKLLGLNHVFYGDTQQTTYVVNDNIVNNEFFISDSISLSFDGFYPINRNNVGPFYIQKNDDIFAHTLEESVELLPDVDNYVSIQSLNDNFLISGNDISLTTANPGYYLVTRDSFLTFNFTLFFETLNNIQQNIEVKLIDSNNNVYNTQSFQFIGDSSPEDRVINYNYDGFFNSGQKIYLVIKPINTSCILTRYERINYDHIDLDSQTYTELDDPRFRLFFNNGFVSGNKYFDGFNIKSIYNKADLDVNNLILAKSDQVSATVPLLNIQYTKDPIYLVNKLYNSYYREHSNTEILYDTTTYDKLINYDKVDFKFKIRSKNPNPNNFVTTVTTGSTTTSSGAGVGVESTDVEFEFSFSDYYLGGLPKQTDSNNVTNAITIGKNVRQRINNHNNILNYIPAYSFYNNISLGSSLQLTQNNFKSYDNGIFDYIEFDYSFDLITQIRNKKRFITTTTPGFNIYKLENEIYNSEIYQAILDKAPLFNERIINYTLNDVVKVPIENYKEVIAVQTGGTIENKTVYRLYVCINDIHESHLYKKDNTKGIIHEIYRPRGARSCFVEIEKYNTTNFDSWGYDDLPFMDLLNSNTIDYLNKNIIPYTGATEFNYGDVFTHTYDGNDEYFKFVYPKSLKWNDTKQYYRGEFVYHEISSVKSFYVARTENKSVSPADTNTWMILTGDTIFNHQSLLTADSLVANGINSFTGTTIPSERLLYSATTVKLPKTLPIGTDNIPKIASGDTTNYTLNGILFGTRWANVLKPKHSFVDIANKTDDLYEVYNYNTTLKSISTIPNIYNGILTNSNGIGYVNNLDYKFENDNYTRYIENDAVFSFTGKTNIFLKPAFPLTALTQGIYNDPIITETSNIYPLFQRLGRVSEKNNPTLFLPGASTGVTYDKNSLYLGGKYTVDRGVLYQFKGSTPLQTTSGTTQPYLDTTNWVEKDFCLVNNFTFYKDRIKVSVTESDIINLTDNVKNSFYFYEKNFSLKNGFNLRYFSGNTINERLINALDVFYDVTDKNRNNVRQFGQVNFRKFGTDLFLDYFYEKDELGFPVTGEFLGKLKSSNPCGQTATTIFGVLFDVNINSLDRQKGLRSTPIITPQVVNVLPYIVRVIVTQNGNSNANFTLTTNDANGATKINNYTVTKFSKSDNSIAVIPQNSLTFQISYDTANNQTQFNSSALDTTSLFVNNTTVSDNNVYTTRIERNGAIETRTILIKNVTENKTLTFNLEGLFRTQNVPRNTSAVFNTNNINIKNINL